MTVLLVRTTVKMLLLTRGAALHLFPYLSPF